MLCSIVLVYVLKLYLMRTNNSSDHILNEPWTSGLQNLACYAIIKVMFLSINLFTYLASKRRVMFLNWNDQRLFRATYLTPSNLGSKKIQNIFFHINNASTKNCLDQTGRRGSQLIIAAWRPPRVLREMCNKQQLTLSLLLPQKLTPSHKILRFYRLIYTQEETSNLLLLFTPSSEIIK